MSAIEVQAEFGLECEICINTLEGPSSMLSSFDQLLQAFQGLNSIVEVS